MVNSTAKSSNLCLSHVHFHTGVPHDCITLLLHVMLMWSSKTASWLYLQSRPRPADLMASMFPGKYDRGSFNLSCIDQVRMPDFCTVRRALKMGINVFTSGTKGVYQPFFYPPQWFVTVCCCFWIARQQTQSVLNGCLNMTNMKSLISKNQNM